MHRFTMLACSLLPGRDATLVHPEGGDDSLEGTTKGEQGKHPDHDLQVGSQPIERRSLPAREGLFAGKTFPAISEAIMDTQVPCADDAS
jgi:hypothetical protein